MMDVVAGFAAGLVVGLCALLAEATTRGHIRRCKEIEAYIQRQQESLDELRP